MNKRIERLKKMLEAGKQCTKYKRLSFLTKALQRAGFHAYTEKQPDYGSGKKTILNTWENGERDKTFELFYFTTVQDFLDKVQERIDFETKLDSEEGKDFVQVKALYDKLKDTITDFDKETAKRDNSSFIQSARCQASCVIGKALEAFESMDLKAVSAVTPYLERYKENEV
jgi:hypothetical protein